MKKIRILRTMVEIKNKTGITFSQWLAILGLAGSLLIGYTSIEKDITALTVRQETQEKRLTEYRTDILEVKYDIKQLLQISAKENNVVIAPAPPQRYLEK